jgi:CRISPR system Cascade subunit CasA
LTGSSALAAPADRSSAVTFNLWTEPWIHALTLHGLPERLGLRDCLVRAHELSLLSDPSPLVVACLQRLLAAIAQDIFRPASVLPLAKLIQSGAFPEPAVDAFGEQYAPRFDLFSENEPFLQTGDIQPAVPTRKGDAKTVAYLFPEEPSATNINHFFHRYDDESQYSPATAATGLITMSAFAIAGGAGIKPSINGVPPLYVLPFGENLFETIAYSIVTSEYQPPARDRDNDRPAWRRDTSIKRSEVVEEVGYLDSLTFPARRVRLFPERTPGYCSRSGEFSDVLVRRMVFEMGWSRPKEAEFWRDPFAAYRRPDPEKPPTPVRPQEGKALWREFGTLFQTQPGNEFGATVVEQMANLAQYGVGLGQERRFRCIGLRTDMKAKVFEWVDDSLNVPTGLLGDDAGYGAVTTAIERAEAWNRRVTQLHGHHYLGDDYRSLRERMRANYWVLLATPFRQFVAAAATEWQAALNDWSNQLFDTGEQVLNEAIDAAGDRGEALKQRAEALTEYRIARASQRTKWEQADGSND